MGLTKCRVFVSGENLWTGTSLSSLFDRKQLVEVMVVMLIRYQAPGLLA